MSAPVLESKPGLQNPKRRLFWRVYLNGILLLVTVAVAIAAVWAAIGDSPHFHKISEKMFQLLAQDVSTRLGDPTALDDHLAALQTELDTDLAVFDTQGNCLAKNASNLRPLDQQRVRRLQQEPSISVVHRNHRLFVAIPLSDEHYLLGSWHKPKHRVGPLVVIMTVLLALALASFPLARAIARPLAHLTATAHKLASGDLSARTQMTRQDELGQLASSMDYMADQLHKRIKSERELLTNISHEIRTPLARLQVGLELCAENPDDPAVIRTHLAGMDGDIAELNDLIENVLMTAKLENAPQTTMHLNCSMLDMAALLEKSKARFGRYHPQHRLLLELALDQTLVWADASLIRRLVDNLLDNAVHHCDPEKAITLRAQLDQGCLMCQVCDQGTGVRSEQLARIFEPFYRTEQSRNNRSPGSGIGLTLCQRIVQAHAGTIQARHNQPQGLIVEFRIPLNPTASPSEE